ncbi:MAG: hypothetical protein JWP35_4199 [Caulobacter sp.]|nr:hypothetical protein [Caulobacter sp.]
MSDSDFRALGASRLLLQIMRVLNLLFAVLLVGMFVASFVVEPVFREFFTKYPARANPGLLIAALRVWMAFALPMLAAVHIMLTRLLAIVDTVGAGTPFVPENASRMKTIAWCLLAVQGFDLVCGAMSAIMNAAGSRIDWHFNLTGWAAVALLFVLARVFEEGTRIRTDLEAMI